MNDDDNSNSSSDMSLSTRWSTDSSFLENELSTAFSGINEVLEDENADFSADDDEEMVLLEEVVAGMETVLPQERNNMVPIRNRIDWDKHVQQLFEESTLAFTRMYRMDYSSFMELVEIVRPNLTVDEVMSRVRAGNQPIIPEISLHCLLRWFAGGSYLDIRVSVGISVRTFYRNMKKCMASILQSAELAYRFPTDLEAASREFGEISAHGAMFGCVACVDGYLLRIQVPSSKETPNVKAFYSGHYNTYGMNVQAACDHRSRFVSACIAAPGSSSDLFAYGKTNLSQQVNNLPIGKFIVGDNAYVCTERLLTPFSGNERTEPQHDTFNFYLSQVRMRIEMAFGLMTQKWQILKKPLRTKLRMSGELFMCITRIHNFCITNGEYYVSEMQGEPTDQYEYFQSDITVQDVPGTSIMRDRVVTSLVNRGLERPAHNRLRNT
jgi:hypothetical protein